MLQVVPQEQHGSVIGVVGSVVLQCQVALEDVPLHGYLVRAGPRAPQSFAHTSGCWSVSLPSLAPSTAPATASEQQARPSFKTCVVVACDIYLLHVTLQYGLVRFGKIHGYD